MHPDLRKKLEQVLGFQYFGAGSKSVIDSEGNVVDHLRVLTIWCVTIDFRNVTLVVGVIESTKWRRAIVLRVFDSYTTDEKDDGWTVNPPEYKGERYIELAQDWEDPVVEALHSVDLMHRNKGVFTGSACYSYNLFVDTGTTTTEFNCNFNLNPSLQNLWKALWETTEYFVELYDDDELREFISGNGKVRNYTVYKKESGGDKAAPPIDFTRRQHIRGLVR
jgi:hypothetical protein